MPEQELARARIGDVAIVVVEGDLTQQPVDAVVNAANRMLQHGGGLAAALVRAGGRAIQEESDRWVDEHGPLGDGVAVVTTAGSLPAAMVVHTAGPVYDPASDRNELLLRQATSAALFAAAESRARSIALPAISAGIFGYPQEDATAVIASEVVAFARDHPTLFDEIRLVGFDAAAAGDFAAGLDQAT